MAVGYPRMPALFAVDALLPSGWTRDVLLEWDDAGVITKVEAGHSGDGHAQAAGPLLPGIPNVHSHAFQRAMAGLAEFRGHPTDDFWTWREEMYRLVTRLGPEDVEAIARHLYIEMLKHGYTTVTEFHYLHNDRDGRSYAERAEMANACRRARARHRATMIPVSMRMAASATGCSRRRRSARERPGVITGWLRVAAFYLPTRAALGVQRIRARRERDAARASTRHALDPRCRYTEPPRRWASPVASRKTGRPLRGVSDLCGDARWCFIHSTHLTKLEMRALAATGASVGLCPMTEANLGDGIFEFVPWFEARSPWSIGGDSHVSVSPFEELRALEYSQRLRHRVRNVVSDEEAPDVPANLWHGAASGGAQAVGHPVGAIAAGRRADLVVLDGGDADFEELGAAAILGVALFSGNANRVRDVLIAGKPVIEQGRHLLEDEASDAFRAALRRLRAPP